LSFEYIPNKEDIEIICRLTGCSRNIAEEHLLQNKGDMAKTTLGINSGY